MLFHKDHTHNIWDKLVIIVENSSKRIPTMDCTQSVYISFLVKRGKTEKFLPFSPTRTPAEGLPNAGPSISSSYSSNRT